MKEWGRSMKASLAQVRHTLNLMLREIFDESAYARFLQREGVAASKTAYRSFIREQGELKARRPKCC